MTRSAISLGTWIYISQQGYLQSNVLFSPRVVGLRNPEGSPLDPSYMQKCMEIFAEQYEKMVEGHSITCSVRGHDIKPVMSPEVMFMDVCQLSP